MEIKHQLYTNEDFKHMSGQEMEESWVARMVLDGGLAICKICGEGEAGLDDPCNPKKEWRNAKPKQNFVGMPEVFKKE